jgi:hypothetical protein
MTCIMSLRDELPYWICVACIGALWYLMLFFLELFADCIIIFLVEMGNAKIPSL